MGRWSFWDCSNEYRIVLGWCLERGEELEGAMVDEGELDTSVRGNGA